MEIIQTGAGTQFTSKDFQEVIYVRGVRLALAAPEHQEINGQVKVVWQALQNISHSIMVHAQVSEKYIHLALMYTIGNISPVLPIKHLVNQDSEPNMSHKLSSSTKHSVKPTCFIMSVCFTKGNFVC